MELNVYELYFEPGLLDKPYGFEKEFREDLMTGLDAWIFAVCEYKALWQERLDMRGVVITPQEFEAALKERFLETRREEGEKKAAVRMEIKQIIRHIKARAEASGESFLEFKIIRAALRFQLTELEWFLFFLAAAVEWDRKYERIYGYLQDNVGARLPTVGLGLSLWALGQEHFEDWCWEESPLFRFLLEEEQKQEEESGLSHQMKLRAPVISWLTGGTRSEEETFQEQHKNGMGFQIMRSVFQWDDLIMEEEGKAKLKQLCARIHFKDKVGREWGFLEKSPYGNGASALFYGPPGTGKTMAAQVVAKELGACLCRVDISSVVSKYIGETEKNLSRIFDEAEKKHYVLFFDEADSLFAKRSQVGSSNDRYANMETGFLLQKFEEYEGVSILATNYLNNMDDAFKRRITFLVRFSLPGAEDRLKMWKTMVPGEALVDEELELSWFSERFELTGSAIKEILTASAYLAAEEGHGINNEVIRESIRGYYQKYGKSLTREELVP